MPEFPFFTFFQKYPDIPDRSVSHRPQSAPGPIPHLLPERFLRHPHSSWILWQLPDDRSSLREKSSVAVLLIPHIHSISNFLFLSFISWIIGPFRYFHFKP